MIRRAALALLLSGAALGLAVPARADRTLVYHFQIAGSPVGESRVMVKDDGTFAGSTALDFGQKLGVTFSGKSVGATTPEFVYTLAASGQEITFRGDGKTGTLAEKGQKDSRRVDDLAKLPAKFSAFAPYLSRALKPLIDAGTPTFDALIFDRFGKDKVILAGTSKRQAGTEPITVATIRVGALELSVAYDRQGECVGYDVPAQKFRVTVDGFEGAFVSPVDTHPELSRATFATERTSFMLPMRDGKSLATELIRPKTTGTVPTILIRTPYGRAAEALANGWYAPRGYAVMVQDCRGRGGSEGAWDPFVNEGQDGEDAIAWIAGQPWSDGKVGMIGASYGGFVQWAAAARRPAALKCIVPQVSPPASAMRNLPYVNGVPMLLSNLWWLRIVEKKDADLSFYSSGFAGAKRLTTLPLLKVDDAVFGHNMPMWDTWIRRDSAAKWNGWNFQSKLAGVSIPTLSISGYFDGDEIGTMLNWDTRRGAGWTNGWLIYGPWPHGFNASTKFGGVDFGKDSQLDLDSVYLRFFDTYLKGAKVGWTQRPKVSAFVTGANEWIAGDDWPLAETEERSLYLAGTGTKDGGRLVSAPVAGDPPSRTVYDPARAEIPAALSAPKMNMEGNLTFAKGDLAKRGLLFRTEPMKTATRVAGPITLEATIATSARSTDLFVVVLDEAPNGTLRAIGQTGVARLGAKNGDEQGTVRPNTPNSLRVRLWDFVHEFAPGHRLVLVVSNDGFPSYARNLGTGEPVATGTRMVIQRNTLYHDAKRPTRLRFRVLP